MSKCDISAGGAPPPPTHQHRIPFFILHLPPWPLPPPRCDNYLVVMDKAEVPAVEVVRPGHRSRGDRSKDRVPPPPPPTASISHPLSPTPFLVVAVVVVVVVVHQTTTGGHLKQSGSI